MIADNHTPGYWSLLPHAHYCPFIAFPQLLANLFVGEFLSQRNSRVIAGLRLTGVANSTKTNANLRISYDQFIKFVRALTFLREFKVDGFFCHSLCLLYNTSEPYADTACQIAGMVSSSSW